MLAARDESLSPPRKYHPLKVGGIFFDGEIGDREPVEVSKANEGFGAVSEAQKEICSFWRGNGGAQRYPSLQFILATKANTSLQRMNEVLTHLFLKMSCLYCLGLHTYPVFS